MRVREYLAFRAGIKGLHGSPARKRIEYVMARCWVDDVRSQLIGTISKGYRQRVGLADALLADPPVLILDEPTAGLDPKQIRETRKLIKELGEQHTILLSTHILPEVEMTCSHVILINRGQVATSGRLKDLRRTGKASDLFVKVVEATWRKSPPADASPRAASRGCFECDPRDAARGTLESQPHVYTQQPRHLGALGALGLVGLIVAIYLASGLFQARSLIRRGSAPISSRPSPTSCWWCSSSSPATSSSSRSGCSPRRGRTRRVPDARHAWRRLLLAGLSLHPAPAHHAAVRRGARTGTLEMLMTTPLREWQIVLGKYIACLAFYVVLWLPTLVYLPVLLDLRVPVLKLDAFSPWA
jgi:energy-coupling factor transporter ATP-binding protein EcfA2